MKTEKLFVFLALIAALSDPTTVDARQVSTSFTYQGRLENSGVPVNTPQEFLVTLYNDMDNGAPVGAPSVNRFPCETVVNGLFTLTLNFGDLASYDCQARWLKIEVRPCGSAVGYQAMGPRVELLPTPYALQSLSACRVEPNGIIAASIQDGAINGSKIAGGQVVKSLSVNGTLPGLTDAVNLVAGANVTLTPSGNNIQISAAGGAGGGGWSLNGNGGTVAGSFLGTLDLQPLELRVNNARGLRLDYYASRSGLATTYAMNVNEGFWGNSISSGAIGATISGGGESTDSSEPRFRANHPNVVVGSFGTVGGGFGNTAGFGSVVPGGLDNQAMGLGSFTAGRSNVVSGNYGAVTGGSSNGVNGHFGAVGGGYRNLAGFASAVPGGLENQATGVGSFAAGRYAKTIYDGNFVWGDGSLAVGGGLSTDFYGTAPYAFDVQASGGVFFHNGVSGVNVDYSDGNRGGLNFALKFGRSGGEGIGSKRSVGGNQNGLDFYTLAQNRLSIAPYGHVGIGTDIPQANLHVNVPASSIVVNAMDIDVQSFGTVQNSLVSHFLRIRDVGSTKTQFYVRGDGNVGIGTDSPQTQLDVRGMTRTCVLQITGGCDLAEPFQMSDREIQKGSLVIIDEDNEGKLKLAGQPYDTRVAGIVSGARGVNTGISLRQEGVMDDGQDVALSGRVYAWADAGHGSIKPGDLLTSSSTPGHVMRVADHAKAHGAIVGKAMSSLREGKGMVLILVSLH